MCPARAPHRLKRLEQPPCPAPVPPMPPGVPMPPTSPPGPDEDPPPIDDPHPTPLPLQICWTMPSARNSGPDALLRESALGKGNIPMPDTKYDSEKPVPKPDSEKDHDRDEALEDSFPASDPPSKGETTGPDE
ncbi:hypothetical protein F1645_08915 [Novacetimonas hansenii]|uniref:Uncharacterized protein n=2 Tax=Novacetimonas hansenii TaxID=436 RepID=A0AAW5ET50_NOVHA|nr:hypothetical protein [Novacetimonas hansenii]MCJ8354480.1 hypothetical protein [Novacetimonas hansenii]WEQ58626.1 hypothetical protein LV563_12395 [Novacetimonas hansenii]CUW48204.1 hypothetical protein ATCC53582_02338 [Novacetimonas hansenii]